MPRPQQPALASAETGPSLEGEEGAFGVVGLSEGLQLGMGLQPELEAVPASQTYTNMLDEYLTAR